MLAPQSHHLCHGDVCCLHTQPPRARLQWQPILPPGSQIPHSPRLSSLSTLLGSCIWLGNSVDLNTVPASPPGRHSLVMPTEVSAQVSFCLIPASFHFSMSLLSLLPSKWLPTSGNCTAGLGTGDAPSPMLVMIISVPRRAVPGVVARKRVIVASPCLWL